jgi:transcriptional regulator with XRE-family HTH domain
MVGGRRVVRVVREDGTMASGGPAVPARRLGRELKRLREALGKTQTEVAQYVGAPSTTISKIETGERNAPIPHLKLMLQLYQVEPEHAETLIKLAEQAREPGWWVDYSSDLPKWFREYVRVESDATQVWTYEQGYVPGLLQTRNYTEAITVATNTTETSESAEGFARVRAARQQRLIGEEPLVLQAVIDEAVLRRGVGGPDVMREQIARLLEAMSQPNITLRVLPFSAGAHPALTGSFIVLRFVEKALNMVYVELCGSAVYLDAEKDIDVHESAFTKLSELALSKEDTTSLLSEIERGYSS